MLTSIAPRFVLQHWLAEGAATPEESVEVDVDDVQPMLVGKVLRRGFRTRNAGVADENVHPSALLHDLGGGGVDLRGVGDVHLVMKSAL